MLLVVEPFYAGSHRQLADLLAREFAGNATMVSLPGRKWHWRVYAGALHFAQALPAVGAGDVVFCTSMVSLAELAALRPDVARARKVLYFHETQLAYPRRQREARDFALFMAEVQSALVADAVCFNSAFCRDSFLDSIDGLMRQVPEAEMRVLGLAERIRPKTAVLAFPVARPPPPPPPQEAPAVDASRELWIAWPHRWEHDKGPDAFFAAARELAEAGEAFKLVVLGESYAEAPAVFAEARAALEASGHVAHWGFAASRAEYERLLQASDVVVSTAQHEFFGVAMLEAALRGCYPLCPDRLVYPELYPRECLYRTDRQLVKRLRGFCRRPATARAWDAGRRARQL